MPATLFSGVLLIIALIAVVALAKVLSYPISSAISYAGLEPSFLGVIIAALVLTPEGLASVRAALSNRLQDSINLAVGSAIACIGLTVPAVALVSVILGKRITLGLGADGTVLLVLTLFVSTLTLGTGKTTVLHGAVHLVIFAVFLLFSGISLILNGLQLVQPGTMRGTLRAWRHRMATRPLRRVAGSPLHHTPARACV